VVLGEHKDSLWEGSRHLEAIGDEDQDNKCAYVEKKKLRTRACGELEGGGNGSRGGTGLDLDAFTDEDVVDIFHIKARNTAFEKSITLCEPVFEMFSMSAEGESLSMSVFLVTGGSGGCAGGASRMFRVALKR